MLHSRSSGTSTSYIKCVKHKHISKETANLLIYLELLKYFLSYGAQVTHGKSWKFVQSYQQNGIERTCHLLLRPSRVNSWHLGSDSHQ